MRFLPLRSLLLLPCLALIGMATIGLAGCGSSDGEGAVPQPKHIAYISELGDEGNMKRLLPTHAKDFVEIGLYRQMPAQTTALPPSNRIARIDGTSLARHDAHGMASKLMAAIDGSCTTAMPCTSGLVGIDDIAREFHGDVGANFLAAMQHLQDQGSPLGGSYADRVVMYIDYDVLADLDDPRHAGRWRDAIAAAALGNSMWLEMYDSTGVGTMNTLPLAEWKAVPKAATAALVAGGATPSQVHLMIGPWVGRLPGQTRADCNDTLTCVWHAAASTPLNQQLLRNGVGMYRYTRTQLSAFCVFIWTADPRAEPDARARDDCAHWLAGELDYWAPGSDEALN